MATIKSYTDIEQSKKLAEILPIESADMYYQYVLPKSDKIKHNPEIGNPIEDLEWYNKGYTLRGKEPLTLEEYCIPCWSLAALLELLPNEISTDDSFANHYQIDIRKHDWYDNTTLYQIGYGNDRGSSGEWSDMINTGQKENLIDCCVQMILRLNELNLL